MIFLAVEADILREVILLYSPKDGFQGLRASGVWEVWEQASQVLIFGGDCTKNSFKVNVFRYPTHALVPACLVEIQNSVLIRSNWGTEFDYARWINSGDLLCSNETIVHNTVLMLEICHEGRSYMFWARKKMVNVWRDGYVN